MVRRLPCVSHSSSTTNVSQNRTYCSTDCRFGVLGHQSRVACCCELARASQARLRRLPRRWCFQEAVCGGQSRLPGHQLCSTSAEDACDDTAGHGRVALCVMAHHAHKPCTAAGPSPLHITSPSGIESNTAYDKWLFTCSSCRKGQCMIAAGSFPMRVAAVITKQAGNIYVQISDMLLPRPAGRPFNSPGSESGTPEEKFTRSRKK